MKTWTCQFPMLFKAESAVSKGCLHCPLTVTQDITFISWDLFPCQWTRDIQWWSLLYIFTLKRAYECSWFRAQSLFTLETFSSDTACTPRKTLIMLMGMLGAKQLKASIPIWVLPLWMEVLMKEGKITLLLSYFFFLLSFADNCIVLKMRSLNSRY